LQQANKLQNLYNKIVCFTQKTISPTLPPTTIQEPVPEAGESQKMRL